MLRACSFIFAILFSGILFSQQKHAVLIARGSEPGWYAEFRKDRLLLVTDYGKDTVTVKHDFSSVFKKKYYHATILLPNSEGGKPPFYTIVVSIKATACIEAGSGEKRERSITLEMDKKILSGCATIR